MRTIDKNTIQSYQNHIYTQEKSKNTIDKYIRDIRTFTAWLQTHEQKDITKKNTIEALDRKIERLQEKVIKKHKEYSVLAEELSTLLDERHPGKMENREGKTGVV